MKQIFFMTAIFAAFTVAAFAQKPTDFSGTWTLDKGKSTLDERMSRGVESMTMTVSQTASELKVSTEMKRMAPPMDAPAGGPGGPGGPGGGRGMGRGFGGGDGTVAYSLEGKETIVEIDGPNGKMPVKYKGSINAGTATLTSSRSLNGPMGEITITGKDVWTMSADGKTLTVVREQTTPRGSTSSTLVFMKK